MRFHTTAKVVFAAWSIATQAASFSDTSGRRANLTANPACPTAQPVSKSAVLKHLPLYTAGLMANMTANSTTPDSLVAIYVVVNHVDITVNISDAHLGLADMWIITTAVPGCPSVHNDTHLPAIPHNGSNICSSSILLILKEMKSGNTTSMPSMPTRNGTSNDDERLTHLVDELKHMHLLLRIPLLSLGIISCLLQIINTTFSIVGTMRRLVHPAKKEGEEPKGDA